MTHNSSEWKVSDKNTQINELYVNKIPMTFEGNGSYDDSYDYSYSISQERERIERETRDMDNKYIEDKKYSFIKKHGACFSIPVTFRSLSSISPTLLNMQSNGVMEVIKHPYETYNEGTLQIFLSEELDAITINTALEQNKGEDHVR